METKLTTNDTLKLVRNMPVDIDGLEAAFDAATHDERLEVVSRFSVEFQARLFDAAHGRLVSVEQLVPNGAVSEEVIHDGINTLPAFRQFQKRFARTKSGDIIGYNHNWYMFATSPGYYVGDFDGEDYVVDYTRLPTEKVSSWPEIIPNESLLGRFIWVGMVDKIRRVSEHVTIGAAYKDGKALGQYFTLIRRD